MNIKMVLEFNMVNRDKGISFDKEYFDRGISELELEEHIKELHNYERTNQSGDGSVYVSEITFRDAHNRDDVGRIMLCCIFFEEAHVAINDSITYTARLIAKGEPHVYFVEYREANDPINNGKYEDRINRCKIALSSININHIDTDTIHTVIPNDELQDKIKNLDTTDGFILNSYGAELGEVSAILISRCLTDVHTFIYKCIRMCNLDKDIREGSRSVRIICMFTQDEYRETFHMSKTNVESNIATLH